MKKVLVIAMVVLVGVSMLALGGCGGQTTEAKAQMEMADKAWENLDAELTKAGDETNKMIAGAMTGDFTAIQQALQEDPQALDKILDTLGAAAAQIDTISKQYQAITTYKGVPDYATYANDMTAAIAAQLTTVAAGRALLEKLLPVLKSGDITQLTAAVQGAAADIAELQDLEKKADEAVEKAKDFQKDKNLTK